MGGVELKRRVWAGLRLLGLGLLAAALGAVVFVLALASALPDEPLLPFWATALATLALLALAGAVLRRLAPSRWPLAAVISWPFVIIGLGQLPTQPGWAAAWLLGPLLAGLLGSYLAGPHRPRHSRPPLSRP
jgi:MFS family permease